MAKPPRDIPPDELVQAFMAPAPSEEFYFTRQRPEDEEDERMHIRVQILRTDELHGCIIAAQKYAKKRGELPKEYGDVYQEAQGIEVAWRCLVHPEMVEFEGKKIYRRIFVNAEQCRLAFTEAEIAYVLNLYEYVKAKYSILEDFQEEDLELWIARLGEGMNGALFLGLLDSQHWPDLLLRLAQRAHSLYQTLGYQLPSLSDTSESDQESSESGTSSSIEPPAASTVPASDEESARLDMPSNRIITKEEAKKKARKLSKRSKKKR